MFAIAPPIRPFLRIATITVSVLGWVPLATAGEAEDTDRIQRAIAYLDARQDEWSDFAPAQRGKDADQTSCVSCHTGLSYALARPALRRFAGKPGQGPAAPEDRMIAAVSLRVEHWDELDSPRFRLMYDGDDRKKVESRGTEAVLDALILARHDAAQGRTKPSETTQAALSHLWRTQVKEGDAAGSWVWLNFGLEPWEAPGSSAFGAALAAIAAGSAPGYLGQELDEPAAKGVGSLRDYLRRRFPDETLYNRVWILEASATLDGILTADQKRKVLDQLIPLQREDGGWSLASFGSFKRVDGTPRVNDSDGYATGVVLHALLRGGTTSASPEVVKGLAWIRSHQQADGSWPGRSVNKERDPATFAGKLMTDAATAIVAQSLIEAEAR